MSRGAERGSVSLEQLQALNDEMAALIRAGIPLERGLTKVAQDVGGRTGGLAQRLGERLNAGENLDDILLAEDSEFPPVWRAVVRAGVRSGDLASALEGLSETARRAAELRRSVLVSLVYPLLLLAIAYLLFLFSVVALAPTMLGAFEDLTSSSNLLLRILTWLGQHTQWWAPWVPLLAVVWLLVWWYRSGRAVSHLGTTAPRAPARASRRWPSLRQMVDAGRMATFVELLALLQRHGVPVREALVLAGDATGDRALSRTARELAERLARGEVVRRREELPLAFPPLLAWALVSGGVTRSTLESVLTTSARMYRRQAERGIQWASIYLPIVLTIALGGTAVLAYALVTVLPLVQLIYKLQLPV